MNNTLRKIVAAALAATVSISAGAMSVSAAWNQNASGQWSWTENGKKATGWKLINGKWYYMDQNGTMQTGWKFINGKWYHLQSSGAMTTGWVKDKGEWYHLSSSGAMTTGWMWDGQKWYHLESSGAMSTGWVKDNGEWYHMNSSGAMETGFYTVGDQTYFSSASGEMQSGVVEVDGEIYYFGDENDGSMKTGKVKIDGITYNFDENGECTSVRKPTADVAFNTDSETGGVAAVEPTVPETTVPSGGSSSVPETPVDTSTHVKDQAELVAAITDETVEEITLDASFAITETIVVNRSVKINGAGYTISAGEGALSSTYGKNNVLLLTADNVSLENIVLDAQKESTTTWGSIYTLSAYRVSGIVLEDVTVRGGNTGILANGSTITLEGTTTVTGNGLGGIEVSQGSGVEEAAVLNVNGSIVISDESMVNPAVRIDFAGASEGTVNWAGKEAYHYTDKENNKDQYFYFADEAIRAQLAATMVKTVLTAAAIYEYDDEYEATGTVSVNGTSISYICSATDLIGSPTKATADLARYLGAIYRVGVEKKGYFSAADAITYENTEYIWKAQIGLTGSNWADGETTLVSVIVGDIGESLLASRPASFSFAYNGVTVDFSITITE